MSHRIQSDMSEFSLLYDLTTDEVRSNDDIKLHHSLNLIYQFTNEDAIVPPVPFTEAAQQIVSSMKMLDPELYEEHQERQGDAEGKESQPHYQIAVLTGSHPREMLMPTARYLATKEKDFQHGNFVLRSKSPGRNGWDCRTEQPRTPINVGYTKRQNQGSVADGLKIAQAFDFVSKEEELLKVEMDRAMADHGEVLEGEYIMDLALCGRPARMVEHSNFSKM